MTRIPFRALAAVALAIPVANGLAQLPGAKYPPPKGTPAPFVPKNRNDRPKPPTPVWREFPLDPKATLFLDFTESSADAVLSIFSRTSGITILRDPSFKVPLTVTSAKAVGLDKAFGILDTVLGFHGYQLQKRGDLLVVGKIPPPQPPAMAAPPPPPQPVVKTYPLLNANAAQVARVLTEIFGAAAASPAAPSFPSFPGGMVVNGAPGGAPGGRPAGSFKATSEDYSNSVIVQAVPVDQTKAEELIKDLDKKTTQALQSELFVLKYVPADQAVTAIEDLLTANSPTGRGAARENNNRQQNYFSYYDPYGSNNRNQHTAGGQSATPIKQTNSVLVNATRENMDLIRGLLKNLDQPGAFVGTTFVMRLENAKASDVADLLTKLFAQQQNNNNGGFFIFDYNGLQNGNNKSALSTDVDENGQVVNVRDIAGKVNVVADPNTNSIVVQTQPANMRMIRPIVEKLDVPVTQVMIETVIVEANLDRTDKLGVEYGTLGSVLSGSDTGSGSIDFGIASATGLQGLKYTIGNPDYKIFLNAVQSDSRFKVLDTPRIFTSNNAKASINVGEDLPYITNTSSTVAGVVTSYAFQPVAVNLTVTPRITAGGQVTMDVTQTANDLQGYTSYNAPIINNRTATTTVSVADGETIVLGGIIRQTTTDSKVKVPILGDLPLLGYLFRSTSREKGQTELMVFMTPHVVRTNADAQRLRRDQTGELSKPSQDDLKRHVPPVKGKTP